ncbi:hypothetical protein H0V99_00070 [Candidatus Saccharibacteria bacterium]|nr:hypothetical protein [Candidatus Saccharibacteria bacterium]
MENDQPQVRNEVELEENLRATALQLATREYRQALFLDDTRDGYLQGVQFETPEPTTAFRMDSKRAFITDSQEIIKQKLYVYVPQDTDFRVFLPKIWTKFVLQTGEKGMFAVDQKGARVYRRHPSELSIPPLPDTEIEGDFTVRRMLEAGVRQKVAIRGLKAIIKAMRDDFEHVPFYS